MNDNKRKTGVTLEELQAIIQEALGRIDFTSLAKQARREGKEIAMKKLMGKVEWIDLIGAKKCKHTRLMIYA